MRAREAVVNPVAANVAARAMHLRGHRGMSVRKLAESLTEAGAEISRATWTNLETGRREDITVDEVVALATVFGHEVTWFFSTQPFCEICQDDPPRGFNCAKCWRHHPDNAAFHPPYPVPPAVSA